ncbi:hypothetical protein BDR22DRAFT_883853 [Usnea florida]
MKLLHFLTALLTVLALSPPTIQCPPPNKDPDASTCYASVRRWPARATSQPRMPSSPTKTDFKASTCHVPVPIHRWPARVTIQPRMHRARPDELSLSPPALPNFPASTSNNTSKDNSSTNPSPQGLSPPLTWVLTLEDLITAMYRIVSILLTVFNINITWRFHAHHAHQPREARHAWDGVRFV